MIRLDWHGLYRKKWGASIVPVAVVHPAKFAPGLICKIYDYLFEIGALHAGDRVIDPFGGVALGAYDAMRRGLHWTGVELEQKFVELGAANIDLWNARYRGRLPHWGTARLLQGDSRKLAEVIGAASATVSSPPYARSLEVANGIDKEKIASRFGPNSQAVTPTRYGASAGQLGQMPEVSPHTAAISSPPYEGSNQDYADGWKYIDGEKAVHNRYSHQRDSTYGEAVGQIGNRSGETFWSASRLIVEQVYQVLIPGGVAAWVVKDFVRNKQIVPFCDQWRQLCEACGFETFAIARAWLVEDHGVQLAHDGNHKRMRTERKSFFRRLAEKKGAPRIDYETVLFMRKI